MRTLSLIVHQISIPLTEFVAVDYKPLIYILLGKLNVGVVQW